MIKIQLKPSDSSHILPLLNPRFGTSHMTGVPLRISGLEVHYCSLAVKQK